MVVRSVSVHSPANAALGARTDLRIQALPHLYRITPTPCIDIDFGARPYFFYYSLCINYLLCNDFLIIIITIISGLHFFCAHENDPETSAALCRSAMTVLCHHFGLSGSPLRHLGTGLGDGTLSRIKLGPRHQCRTH